MPKGIMKHELTMSAMRPLQEAGDFVSIQISSLSVLVSVSA